MAVAESQSERGGEYTSKSSEQNGYISVKFRAKQRTPTKQSRNKITPANQTFRENALEDRNKFKEVVVLDSENTPKKKCKEKSNDMERTEKIYKKDRAKGRNEKRNKRVVEEQKCERRKECVEERSERRKEGVVEEETSHSEAEVSLEDSVADGSRRSSLKLTRSAKRPRCKYSEVSNNILTNKTLPICHILA